MANMTHAERRLIIRQMEKALEIVKNTPAFSPCGPCAHFNEKHKTCSFHGGPVPEEFIEQGCDDWEGVPF